MIKNNLKIELIDDFIAKMEDEIHYVFIGNEQGSNASSEFVDAIDEDEVIWRNAIGFKRLSPEEASTVIPRVDWTSGEVYSQYDPSVADVSNCYAYSSNSSSVYICVLNGDGAGSTVEPTTLDGEMTGELADGYIWRHLYEITPLDQYRFLTDDFLPISPDPGAVENAVDGAIEYIYIDDAGSYPASGEFDLTVSGEGTGFTGTANIAPSGATNVVSSVSITSRGSGYRNPTISIDYTSGTPVSNASFTALVGHYGGIGYDPRRDLRANSAMICSTLAEDELLTDIGFNYFGLIKNPKDSAGFLANDLVYDQYVKIDLTGFLDATYDDFSGSNSIYQAIGGEVVASGDIIKWSVTENSAYVVNVSGEFTIAESDIYSDDMSDSVVTEHAGQATSIASIVSSDLTRYSGIIMTSKYIDEEQRNDDQTDKIRISFTL